MLCGVQNGFRKVAVGGAAGRDAKMADDLDLFLDDRRLLWIEGLFHLHRRLGSK